MAESTSFQDRYVQILFQPDLVGCADLSDELLELVTCADEYVLTIVDFNAGFVVDERIGPSAQERSFLKHDWSYSQPNQSHRSGEPGDTAANNDYGSRRHRLQEPDSDSAQPDDCKQLELLDEELGRPSHEEAIARLEQQMAQVIEEARRSLPDLRPSLRQLEAERLRMEADTLLERADEIEFPEIEAFRQQEFQRLELERQRKHGVLRNCRATIEARSRLERKSSR